MRKLAFAFVRPIGPHASRSAALIARAIPDCAFSHVVVMDDYSRAIAGYALNLTTPSALQTSLALRQAIWRKGEPR
jgi:transposase InsO family protein